MNRIPLALLTALALGVFNAPRVRAVVHAGDAAPNFTKTELDAAAPAERSLSDYSGRIVILFLLGYN